MRAILPIRGTDAQGSGHYGAPRGSRKHNGIDFCCYPGTEIQPFYPGKVTKIGYPYADKLEFRYVQITDVHGIHHRYFYVDPCVKLGDSVFLGDIIGKSQELPYEGITQHIHYEVKVNGEHVDPTPYIEGKQIES